MLARDKHSSLLQKYVNYDRKKFYSKGPEELIKKFMNECNHYLLKLGHLTTINKNVTSNEMVELTIGVSKYKQKNTILLLGPIL